MKNNGIEVDQPEYDVQETNTNKKVEATPDPDMIRRVTRSGAALLASISPSSSVPKSVAFNPEYDMTVIFSSTQHSLEALKVGINSQDRKLLTPTEKSILSNNHRELTPNLSFSQNPDQTNQLRILPLMKR